MALRMPPKIVAPEAQRGPPLAKDFVDLLLNYVLVPESSAANFSANNTDEEASACNQ